MSRSYNWTKSFYYCQTKIIVKYMRKNKFRLKGGLLLLGNKHKKLYAECEIQSKMFHNSKVMAHLRFWNTNRTVVFLSLTFKWVLLWFIYWSLCRLELHVMFINTYELFILTTGRKCLQTLPSYLELFRLGIYEYILERKYSTSSSSDRGRKNA